MHCPELELQHVALGAAAMVDVQETAGEFHTLTTTES